MENGLEADTHPRDAAGPPSNLACGGGSRGAGARTGADGRVLDRELAGRNVSKEDEERIRERERERGREVG